MGSKAYEGNLKAYLLETEPTDWAAVAEGSRTLAEAELTAGTRLLRLISAGGLAITENQNTASQAKLDGGKIGHNIGTREVSDLTLTHEIDFPLTSDAMWNLYSYGDKRWLVVSLDGEPDEATDVLQVYEVETGDVTLPTPAQDTKQNFVVTLAVQDWDKRVVFTPTV